MYELPSDFDSKAFVGRSLESVTFAPSIIALSFDDSCSVTVYGSLTLTESGGEAVAEAPGGASSRLPSCVGRTVVKATTSARSFAVTFDNGATVSFDDDSDQYESFVLDLQGRTIIV